MIPAKSIVTLVVFIFSMIFVIHGVHVRLPFPLPFWGRRKFPINLTTAPIFAIALLCAAQCMGGREIVNGILGTEDVKPYNILILFFSLAYMAITLDVTGILQAAAYWVSNKGGANGWKLYFYFYVMLTLLSVLLGNDPVILSGTAFLVYYTRVVEELQSLPWLISEFAAANTASMVLFVGNPTNVVICEGFRVNEAEFTAYTILPFLACNVTCFIALAAQFYLSNNLPKRITPTHLDVRSVLLDPVSALVGSILLGSCLIVIIVVSFFGVDVWLISLPFAVTKFIFDLAWDHYRFVTGMPMPGRGQLSAEEQQLRHQTTLDSLLSPNDAIGLRDGLRNILPKSSRDVITNGDAAPKGKPTPKDNDDPKQDPSEPPLKANDDSKKEPSLPVSKANDDSRQDPSSPPSKVNDDSKQDTSEPPPKSWLARLQSHFPTFFIALPRLPFALVPFAFSQFILIEGLTRQGWIDIFAAWLVHASKRQIYPTIWLIGVIGVILCNLSGTNIGATILLTKVVRAAGLPVHSFRAAAIALAVASNIGAVSFTFSASLAGLLWRSILEQKGIFVRQRTFAKWNLLPLAVMTTTGLGVVCLEMAVLYGGKGS